MSPLRAVLMVGVLVANGAAADDVLGRLFLTPAQRHALDLRRDGNESGPATNDAGGASATGIAATRNVLLNGVVRRNRGPNVVWVNGTRTDAAGTAAVRLKSGPDQGNRVTLGNPEGTTARLKPGQFWDPATGLVADCYDCSTRSAPANPPTAPPDGATPVAASPPAGP